jgi:hypothetical protein
LDAAPLMPAPSDSDGEEPQQESDARRFFRAIGFGCLMSKGKKENKSPDERGENSSPAQPSHTAKHAQSPPTVEPSQSPLRKNPATLAAGEASGYAESDDNSSVNSSTYDGAGRGIINPYMLYLGTEKTTDFKPSFDGAKLGEPEIVDLSELRPSMGQRQLPVFFTPPSSDIFNSGTALRKSSLANTPPGSPKGVFA